MASEPTRWFVLAGEDARHFEAASVLVDYILVARVEWFDESIRDELRRWRGPDPGHAWWSLTRAFRDAREAGLPVRGNFDGERAPEVGMIRAQLLLWKKQHHAGARIDAGFIARDTDRKSRIDGAKQAVESGQWPFPIVLAYPSPETEAWYLIGFEPGSEPERERLAALRQRLGFCPVTNPERLLSASKDSPRDAKLVLDELTGNDAERRRVCLDLGLEVLRDRGGGCGLATFLAAVEEHVLPLYVASARS